MDEDFERVANPPKRRRISLAGEGFSTHAHSQPMTGSSSDFGPPSAGSRDTCAQDQAQPQMKPSISITTKLAGQTIAPFLAKHIPDQYAPLGGLEQQHRDSLAKRDANTKYCYRHRPDLKCRRKVDEPSMDQLQHVSLSR